MAVITAAEAAAEWGVTTDPLPADVQRRYDTAAALVAGYAPGAPEAIRSEAIVRAGRYLQHANVRDLPGVQAGEVNIRLRPAGDPLRRSGAAALLSPWRARRALRAEAS